MRFTGLAFALFLALASRALAAPNLATVQINDPYELHSFSVGGQIMIPTGGSHLYWHTIPSPLAGDGPLMFDYLTLDTSKTAASQYGKLDFTVESTGTVWMLTTSRFGEGGNDSGGWVPELSSESQLLAQGWSVVTQGVQTEDGYDLFGSNPIDDFNWILFQRPSVAGQSFSIRTEKYFPPIILQNVAPVPEPSTFALLACAGFALAPVARRKLRRAAPSNLAA